MLLADTEVQAEVVEGGAALVFTTSADVAKLRESVQRMVEAHNACTGSGQDATSCPAACMVHSCAPTEAPQRCKLHAQGMVASTANTEEIEGGVRLVFRPRDLAQLATLQQQVATRAEHMAQHPCLKMVEAHKPR